MTRVQWLALGVLYTLVLNACPAYGCQYNVREVGFIDVGIDPYHLVVNLSEAGSPDEAAGLKDTLDVALADTNIRCESVTRSADANQPGRAGGEGVVLVSPDGQSRRLVLPAGGQSLSEQLLSALEAILNSPTRQQILEKAADCYGVVLLIEGPEPDRNTAAREAVLAAITQMGERLEYLPKPIAKGPEMVVLDRQSLAREEVLLWALGLQPQDVNEPHAAIFYGRGRWLGPLFKGEMLATGNLLQVLSIIGADCECGLDHRWLQGTMLPLRWDDRLQQKAAESLGFDPESPMVKMEMVSIVRRGMGGSDYPGVPFGYREIEVGGGPAELSSGSVPEPNGATAEPEETPASVVPPSPAVAAAADAEPTRMEFGILAASLGGMAVLVAAASAVVLWRAKKH